MNPKADTPTVAPENQAHERIQTTRVPEPTKRVRSIENARASYKASLVKRRELLLARIRPVKEELEAVDAELLSIPD